MFNLFNRIRGNFIKELKGIWLAGDWIEKDPSKKLYVMPYFNKENKYIRYKAGEIVPLIKIGNRIGCYKITKMYKHNTSMWADFAGWDDGINYDFKFDHSEKI